MENSVVRILTALTWIRDWYSSLSLCGHKSTSRGPAFVFSSGIDDRAFLVFSMVLKRICTLTADLNLSKRITDRLSIA